MTQPASQSLFETVDDAETTSQVEALAAPEEMCARRVMKKSQDMRKFHQELRWRIANGVKSVAVGGD